MRESVIGVQPNGGCTPLDEPSQFSQYPCRILPPGRDFTAQVPPPPPVGEVDTDGDGDGLPPPDGVHRWLLLPAVLHVHSCTIAPLAVLLPFTSTHFPDGTPVIVLLAFRFHFWLAAPPQAAMISFVPLAVPPPDASRHLVDPPMVTRSSLTAVDVQACSAPPPHVRISSCVPVTDRHLPETGLTSALAVIAAWAPVTSTRVVVAATAAAPVAARA